MNSEDHKIAHMLMAALAMNGYIRQGMPKEFIADASFNIADELMAKYDEERGIVAALKTRKK